jgi:hypothetical protein
MDQQGNKSKETQCQYKPTKPDPGTEILRHKASLHWYLMVPVYQSMTTIQERRATNSTRPMIITGRTTISNNP